MIAQYYQKKGIQALLREPTNKAKTEQRFKRFTDKLKDLDQ